MDPRVALPGRGPAAASRRGRARRLLLVVLGLAGALFAVLLVRAALGGAAAAPAATAAGAATGAPITVDPAAVAGRLAAALRIRTISWDAERPPEAAAFAALRDHLAASYPRLHAALVRESVADHSLLFAWKGSDPTLPPLVLMAHQDVVPVEAGTEAAWAHPPFAGAIADGFVWGRGAMDDKGALVSVCEAVEALLARGFVPRRTVLLAFGHDEEVGGRSGAERIAALLRERGVAPWLVVDEGQAVTVGIVPGFDVPVALIGLAEKGYLSVELVAEGAGGHSSMPPAETASSIVAAAVARVQSTPPPAALDGPARLTFERLAGHMSFGRRILFSNLWLFGPVLTRILARDPATNALVRTTTAATMLEGSVKDNVLPARARAVVNFRIRPGESIASVLEHVRDVVDDARVTVAPLGGLQSEPSAASTADGPAFEALERTIHETFPTAVVAPSLVLAATDARWFAGLSSGVYRFMPLVVTGEDRPRIHGKDERLSLEVLAGMVRFYARLMENASGG